MRALLRINGQRHELDLRGTERLLDVLRDRLGLTGAKSACRLGECGACTVLVDGRPVLACITLAAVVRGEVTTVEGVAEEQEPLCRAFADEGGFQCGFCTPGQVMRALALRGEASPEQLADAAATRRALAGNVCRCTGYAGIVRALQSSASTPTAHRSHEHDREATDAH